MNTKGNPTRLDRPSPGLKSTSDGAASESLPLGGEEALLPEIPTQFGRYRIIKRLGRGGMGSVYLAEDSQLGRNVALKIPRFNEENRARAIERFQREARAAAVLNHPHLCPVHDVGEIDGTPYLTMAFVEGRPLSDYIHTDKGLPQPQVAATVRKMALALVEAHAKGIVHRDLKPANVMINQRKEPIITDFGLAQLDSQEGTRLTQMGMILGTPSYMAPEQVAGNLDAIGPTTDIYSLGVILYEMLTGRLPFEGPVTAVLGQILAVDAKSPAVHRSDLDPRLEAICMKAMAKKVEDRYASMKDVAAALEAYMRSVPAGGATAKDERQSLVNEARPKPKPTMVESPPKPAPKSTMIEPPPLPFTEPVVSRQSGKSARGRSTRRSFVPILLAGGLAVALLAAAITVNLTVIRVETKIGTIVLDVREPGAVVSIDGQHRITVTEADSKESIRIEVEEGRHQLKVTKGGFKTYTDEFTITKGDKLVVRVELQPSAAAPGVVGSATQNAEGASPLSEKEAEVRDKAIIWLKKAQTDRGAGNGDWEPDPGATSRGGWTALAMLALLENGVKPDDPVISRGLKHLRALDSKLLYVVALQTQVFCAAGQPEDAERIKRNVAWLEKAAAYDGQKKLIGWSYTDEPKGRGDTSCTRYAVAALFAAHRAGHSPANPRLWNEVRDLFVRTQLPSGGWRYSETEGNGKETNTMTASAALCLILAAKAAASADPAAERAIGRGLDWLGNNFQIPDANNKYYCLDVMAALGRAREVKAFGSGATAWDWCREGSDLLLGAQRPDGRFAAAAGVEASPVISTAFALRFLAGRPTTPRGTGPVAVAPADNGATKKNLDAAVVPPAKNPPPANPKVIDRTHWVSIMPTRADPEIPRYGRYLADGILEMKGAFDNGNSGFGGQYIAKDGAIRAVVKVDEGNDFMLQFRGINRPDNGYAYECYTVVFDGRRFKFSKHLVQGKGYREVVIKEVPTPRKFDDFFEFKVKAVGDLITAEADGEEVLRARDATLDQGGAFAFKVVDRGTALVKSAHMQIMDFTGGVPPEGNSYLPRDKWIDVNPLCGNFWTWDKNDHSRNWLKMEKGVLTLKNGSCDLGSIQAKNISIQAKFKFTSGENTGNLALSVRGDKDKSYYANCSRKRDGTFVVRMNDQGVERKNVPRDFFELKLTAVADLVTVHLNGEPVIEYRDPDLKMQRVGGTGINAWHCHGEIKDVQVKVID